MFALALACVASGAAVNSGAEPAFDSLPTVALRFAAFKVWQEKAYTSPAAEARALAAFTSNDGIIAAHNSGDPSSYWLGHNQFSDLTSAEFKATHLGGYLSNPALGRERNFDHSLSRQGEAVRGNETDIDWVSRGGVVPVKNQGKCGSCWAFSTVVWGWRGGCSRPAAASSPCPSRTSSPATRPTAAATAG
jgi:cysteine peptidase B